MTAAAKIEPARGLAVYIRVSTDAQAAAGKDSPALQRQAAEAWRQQHPEYPDVVTLEDPGESGGTPIEDRPKGAQLVAGIRAGRFAAVLCFHSSRLCRDVEDAARMRKLFRRTHTQFWTTSQGRLDNQANMMWVVDAGMNEQYRVDLGRWSQAGSHAKVTEVKTEGGRVIAARWLGGITPYGYKIEAHERAKPGQQLAGWLVPDEAPMPGVGRSPADVVREIFRLITTKGLSCVRIAEQLNQQHIPTRYGMLEREYARGVRRHKVAGAWSAGAVRRILVNPTYWGTRLHGLRNPDSTNEEWERKPVECQTPPLVTPEEGAAAARQLRANFIFSRRRVKEADDYLLRGLLRCERCGHMFCGSWQAEGPGGLRYTCTWRPKRRCDAAIIDWDLAAQLKADVTRFFLGEPALLERFAKRRQQAERAAHAPAKVLAGLRKDLARVTTERERVTQLLVKGLLEDDEAKQQRARLKQEQTTLEGRLAEAERAAERTGGEVTQLDEVAELARWVRGQLEGGKLDDATWRRIFQALIVSAHVRTIEGPVKVQKAQRRVTKPAHAVVLVEFAYGLATAFEAAGLSVPGTVPAAMVPASAAERAENLEARRGPKDEGGIAAAAQAVFDSRIDTVAFPFCYLTLRAPKPPSRSYPQVLATIGDHLRKHRLDLGLQQKEVAALIGADPCSVTNWELNRTTPALRFLPGIVRFLGYPPWAAGVSVGERLLAFRRERGLSQATFAGLLGVDPGTLGRWERGQRQPATAFADRVRALLDPLLSASCP